VTDHQLGYSTGQSTPPAPRRRRNWPLIGCLVLVALVTIPGTVVWGLIAASDGGTADDTRHQVKEHVLPPGPGTIELGIRMAEVEISPGPAGSPLRLDADWNAAIFRLDEGLEHLEDAGGGWKYHLRFGARGLALLRHHGHHPSRLRLQIPVDHLLSPQAAGSPRDGARRGWRRRQMLVPRSQPPLGRRRSPPATGGQVRGNSGTTRAPRGDVGNDRTVDAAAVGSPKALPGSRS
jgi:hypothetical protein